MPLRRDQERGSMSIGGSGDSRLSKNQRREAAREKSKALREEHKKKERRTRFLLQGGLGALLIAAAVVVGLVITSGVQPAGPGPLNMLSDGIKIGQGLKAVPTAALKRDAKPVASPANKSGVIDIRIYVDYQCPLCGAFETANADQLKTWVQSGAATLEIHPIAILDALSLGTKYSTRSANAAACVANYSPNSYFDYNALLFANQPKENTEGLTDAQLTKLANQAKATKLDSITDCIKDQTFESWVGAATTRATSGPIAGSNVGAVRSTPTVLINGKKYLGQVNDPKAFAAAVVKADGASYTDSSSTSSPSPSPSTTP